MMLSLSAYGDPRGPTPGFHFFTAQKRSIDKVAGYYVTEDTL